jgi:hypothetical protein
MSGSPVSAAREGDAETWGRLSRRPVNTRLEQTDYDSFRAEFHSLYVSGLLG